jgi:TRAP-type C4-dicarboxylate transport system substrate-binding protein
MRTKVLSLIMGSVLLALTLIGLTLLGAEAEAKSVINLSSAAYLPPFHAITKIQGEFNKALEKATNGRVKIEYFPGGSLLGPTKMHSGVLQGVADIGCAHIGYSRGRFPQTEVFTCPLGFPDAYVAGQCANDYYKEYKKELKEWDGVHVLFLHCTSGGGIFNKRRPVRTMADLKGMTLRSIGLSAMAISKLGATPRDLPIRETYDAIAKGVIDGAFMSIEGSKSFKLAEVCKYLTYSWHISAVAVFYVIMNKNKWDSLPADIQEIFNNVSEEWRQKFVLKWNDINIEGRDYFIATKGNDYYELPEEEGVKWFKASEPVIEEWLAAKKGKGFSEQKQRDRISFIQERIKYWRGKQKELGIPSPAGG